MEQYVCILRGINVSGKRIIKMADLKQLFTDEGFLNVSTYIQSGNVVLSAPVENIQKLTNQISTAINKKFGFEVPVILHRAEDLKNLALNNPFLPEMESAPERLYVTFLSDIPTSEDMDAIAPDSFLPDRFITRDKYVFICYAHKYSDSKLNNNLLERKLKITATTRNWKTVKKLAAMVE